LDDLKNRPTKDDLNNAVKKTEDKFKDYIDPNDKDKLKKAAEDAGIGLTQKDIDDAVQKERDKWKGFIDPKDLEQEAKKAG